MRYPVYQTSLGGNEKRYVNEALDSTWISSKGTFINRFEQGVADYLGAAAATSCCNGTVALHLAMLALNIGNGDEVIVPTLTYIASVNAMAYVGAKPVFVDSLADTLQIDPAKIEACITKKTKAIMVPHLYGHPCDMDAILAIAKKHSLLVIEDTAEAFGSAHHGKKLGTLGTIATFSFFGNKTITTGEGGMLVSNSPALIQKVVHFKNQGLESSNPDKISGQEYWHDIVGYNYRMTNIAAAIGLAQLERADAIIAKKRELREWYAAELADLPSVRIMGEAAGAFSSYWMVCALFTTREIRDHCRKLLREAGVETRPLFPPVHQMPPYASLAKTSYPVAEDVAARGMNIPSYPDLTRDDVRVICQTIRQSLR